MIIAFLNDNYNMIEYLLKMQTIKNNIQKR